MSGKGWWNSAISGLESRLDGILAEDAHAADRTLAPEPATATAHASRHSSRSRPNSRLQDRLAKAVTKAAERADPRPSSDLGSRPQSPAPAPAPAAAAAAAASNDADEGGSLVCEQPRSMPVPTMTMAPSPAAPATPPPPAPRQSLDSTAPRPSTDAPLPAAPEEPPSPTASRDPDMLLTALSALQHAHEETLRSHRDELNAHLERIDALQSKLAYYAQQAAASAKTAAADADATPADKQLAEKDAQIAALMEEGQRLSKTEMKHLTTVKTLRAKALENNKELTTLKQRLSKAEKSITEQSERAKRAEAAERTAQDKLKIVAKIEKDIELIRAEREEAGMTINELRKQLADALSRAQTAEKRVQAGALEAEKRATASLKEDMENLRIEKKLAEERANRELQVSRDEAKSQQDKAKLVELELRGEIANLETKLELLRTRTEEATSNATGESQTTLLRQIETLQTQYALASENWQGIETTLTSRVTALEKERDETAKREHDVRRKARDINSKARRLEDELESINEQARSLQNDLMEQRAAAQKLQTRLIQAEASAQDARAELEREKKLWEVELQHRLDEEKIKWKQELLSPAFLNNGNHLRADSPSESRRRHSPDPSSAMYQRKSGVPRSMSSGMDAPMPLLSQMDRMFEDGTRRPAPYSRQRSTPKTRTSEVGTPPQRQGSVASLTNQNGAMAMDMDEAFDNVSSPQRTINDMISVSTVGAGPSVQLVERMSAAVRRLESEKATSKEELARLSGQRDEARKEVVALMREVEEKRILCQKVETLDKELKAMEQRYETTLEMLGEKTEKVEELEGDVADLKKIYRELVQTMK
ncbi:hypothetical protein ACEQ8H_006910 [Pleosporales sp. CAS-2024a]